MAVFYWESLEPSAVLEAVNLAVSLVNSALIAYEASAQWKRCCAWMVMWAAFVAVCFGTLQSKNPVTMSAVAFSLRLVMLRVLRK